METVLVACSVGVPTTYFFDKTEQEREADKFLVAGCAANYSTTEFDTFIAAVPPVGVH